ncbi:unnamed protein product [Mytilus coruscus]|uniref:DZIP3-like HEPN domain-containing protein n=1 Tax=Mytilus coruscus TaxID=42192 RepID=A0A6J8AIK8_MYTCO|nr:unnamed protein product [Mytilus coruscus]
MLGYRENYFRAGALIVDGGTKAKQKLLQHYLTRKNMTLQTFIEVNQHEIYHLYSEKCCQCSGKHPTAKVLKAKQMEIIFAKNCKRCKIGKGQSGDPFCCSTSKIGVRIEDFDITLLHSILVNICIQLFWDCALRFQGKTFQQFLVENQHSVYHLRKINTSNCCLKSCKRPSTKGMLTEIQWLTLYHIDTKSSSCKTGQTCFCSYSVNTSLVENQLEKATAMTLQKNFCRLRLAVDNLVNHRNTWAHYTECQMSDLDLNILWTEVEDDILFISGYISKECETLAKEEIDLLKTVPLESTPLSHLLTLLDEKTTVHTSNSLCTTDLVCGRQKRTVKSADTVNSCLSQHFYGL